MKPEFTREQEDYICYQIGEWYLMIKDKLVDYNDKPHRLGWAKELLKSMIIGQPLRIEDILTIYLEEKNET